MSTEQDLTVTVNGQVVSLGMDPSDALPRAVIISLFTWRRANPDDKLPSIGAQQPRMGWWGDSFAPKTNDRIGSRLWLLGRAKLTQDIPAKAKEYAEEALKWVVEDGVAARIDVQAERQGLDRLALTCVLYKNDGTVLADVRFANVWSFINV